MRKDDRLGIVSKAYYRFWVDECFFSSFPQTQHGKASKTVLHLNCCQKPFETLTEIRGHTDNCDGLKYTKQVPSLFEPFFLVYYHE